MSSAADPMSVTDPSGCVVRQVSGLRIADA
ncbi:hypothetical protein [Mesorhizobium sp. WSM3882]|nr:hypothetical protein [Mesorhizobium sp. WSM3882]PBB28951.1 hypothetical protein CK214_28225 [Mesorhizobium sp. WSM3882]